MTDTPLVDTHFHLYTTDMPLVGNPWHKPPEDATTDQLLGVLDAHGVGFGVIAAASLYGTYNDYTLRATRQSKRLRGTVILGPETGLYEMERMKAEGIVGVRMFFRKIDVAPDLATPDYRRLLRRIRDLDWHVHILSEHAILPDLIPVFEEAGVKLVIDHFGRANPAEGGIDAPGFKAMLAAIERGHTWVKLSAAYRMAERAQAKVYAAALLRVAGGERLLWGSDWPFAAYEDRVTYASTVAELRDWIPDAAIRAEIGGATPMRLYFSD